MALGRRSRPPASQSASQPSVTEVTEEVFPVRHRGRRAVVVRNISGQPPRPASDRTRIELRRTRDRASWAEPRDTLLALASAPSCMSRTPTLQCRWESGPALLSAAPELPLFTSCRVTVADRRSMCVLRWRRTSGVPDAALSRSLRWYRSAGLGRDPPSWVVLSGRGGARVSTATRRPARRRRRRRAERRARRGWPAPTIGTVDVGVQA